VGTGLGSACGAVLGENAGALLDILLPLGEQMSSMKSMRDVMEARMASSRERIRTGCCLSFEKGEGRCLQQGRTDKPSRSRQDMPSSGRNGTSG